MSPAAQEVTQRRLWIIGMVMIFAVVATAVVLILLRDTQEPPPAKVALTPDMKATPAGKNENPAYQQLLETQNQHSYEQALAEGDSMIATLTAAADHSIIEQPVLPEELSPPQTYPLPVAPVSSTANTAVNQYLVNEIQAIMENWQPVSHTVVMVAATEPVEPLAAAVTTRNISPALPLRAGTILYAYLETAVDSDHPGIVSARISSGKFSGARLIGAFQQSRERVILEFDHLYAVDGSDYRIRAIAIDTREQLPSLTGKVDYHTFHNYILPAAARFAVGFGRAALQADQTVIHGALGSSTVVQRSSTLERELKAAAAEVGSGLVQDLTATKRPPTVRVPAGQDFAVLFLSGDAVETATPTLVDAAQVQTEDIPSALINNNYEETR